MSAIKYRSSVNDAWQDLQVVVGPQGPAGATGATGPAGATGATGAAGADGRGISSITLNNDYTLTITFTDNTSTTTGSIRGPQGEQGPAGSGGSTYTAGDGINITNNVITNTRMPKIITLDGNSLIALRASGGGLTTANETYLSNLFQYGYENYPCQIIWNRTNQGYTNIPFYYLRADATWRKLYFWGVITPNNEETRIINLIVFTFDSNNQISNFSSPDNNPTNNFPGPNGIRIPAFYSPSGSAMGVADLAYYLKNNYTKTSSLATVATSGSYNDLTNTPTIPSLTGYATETYVNQAVGAIPTYSAGTGISISNGVISLNITNANGVSY